jgi:hypothetical protein
MTTHGPRASGHAAYDPFAGRPAHHDAAWSRRPASAPNGQTEEPQAADTVVYGSPDTDVTVRLREPSQHDQLADLAATAIAGKRRARRKAQAALDAQDDSKAAQLVRATRDWAKGRYNPSTCREAVAQLVHVERRLNDLKADAAAGTRAPDHDKRATQLMAERDYQLVRAGLHKDRDRDGRPHPPLALVAYLNAPAG